ncbi:metallophosphoesterase family protein [Mycolicibacterium arseniciresistens]|uniref:Metallophosphoesterase n=1 Tax=Mycolicibacterium arseniciresistens TaxID=3062257 RepID=A0ABT8UPN5_9MYCO|nr:metallophosphoesterase [Mycolicibacterium arseniciresistens]MDO3639751.1 metallophosphoesterase [Mycolicibacterium arseniciresistens]
MQRLTAVVVSDLHATSTQPGDSAGSWLTTHTPRNRREHPLVGLREYFEDAKMRADLLLVAGDICDKADGLALEGAWTDLAALADALGARLIATAGNHDLDSRHKSGDMDPRGALYDLVPPFPALDPESRDQFWAKNYSIVEGTESSATGNDGEGASVPWRVVTLNSAAFHGYAGGDGPELDHGRISPRTARRLRAELDAGQRAVVNILLVHHHLQQMPYVDTQERSMIQDVELLTQLLEDHSPWIVIHGHKHRARVMYAPGEGFSATIFSAGSLSAYPEGQNAGAGITNQAYILEFADQQTLDAYDLGVAGNFCSLQWVPGQGWRKATGISDFSLPGSGGFGWRAPTLAPLARRIARVMKQRALTKLPLGDLMELEPKLSYLSPTGISKLTEELKNVDATSHLKRDEYGEITEVVAVTQSSGGTPT